MTAAPVVPVVPIVPRAPEGTRPGTVWFWLLAFTPLLQALLLIPTSIYLGQITSLNLDDPNAVAAATFSPAAVVNSLLSFALIVILILFPILDARALRKRGIERPFHWAWSLFALVLGNDLVYVIGRTVVAKRRTGAGIAPLWIYVALGVVDFIITSVVITLYLVDLFNQFSTYLLQAGNVL